MLFGEFDDCQYEVAVGLRIFEIRYGWALKCRQHFTSVFSKVSPVSFTVVSTQYEMALRNMKNGKATGPDNLPVEVWKSLGRTGVTFLKEALNKITDGEKIPDIWRKSILIPIYKNEGDAMNCGNYRGIKLMCHSMKLYERVHDDRLRNIVSISEEQFVFVKGKSTTDAVFALRQLQESYRE